MRLELQQAEWKRVSPKYVVVDLVGNLIFAVVVVGAIILLVAGLVAEHWCTIPPDDDSHKRNDPKHPGTPDPQGLT